MQTIWFVFVMPEKEGAGFYFMPRSSSSLLCLSGGETR